MRPRSNDNNDALIECGAHGRRVPAYLVCEHILTGTALAIYRHADVARGDCGSAFCAACAEDLCVDMDRVFRDFVKVVCTHCLSTVLGSRRPA
jgi:hypothetical protein